MMLNVTYPVMRMVTVSLVFDVESHLEDTLLKSLANAAYTYLTLFLVFLFSVGLGLPHTDEDHFNRDRGDCMDYTTRPQNNMMPGDYNLELLKQLYGTSTEPIDPSIFSNKDETTTSNAELGDNNGGNIVGTPPPPFRPNYGNDDEEDDEKDNKDKKDKDDRLRRHLRGLRQRSRRLATDEEIFQAELEVQYSCKDDYCYVQIDDVHALEVTKFVHRRDTMV